MFIEKSEQSCKVKIDNIALEQVNEFVYLGNLLSRNGKTEDDIK